MLTMFTHIDDVLLAGALPRADQAGLIRGGATAVWLTACRRAPSNRKDTSENSSGETPAVNLYERRNPCIENLFTRYWRV
jgi:hypothetical protein